ncbi:MAG TPA: hypothetical protein VMF04_00435 [Thermoplasmata archaeon]|nr:hypothetical protein [Thermoplasmata archaeon]
MLVHPGESKLRSAYAVMDAYGPEAYRGPGVLYLTTQRLVFESSVSPGLVRGLVQGRETVTVLDAPIAHVRNASVRRRRLASDLLVVELTAGRPTFDVLDPEGWISQIGAAKRTTPPALTSPPVFVQTIERQVVKVRCRYCGSLGNEVDGRCPNCGAPL